MTITIIGDFEREPRSIEYVRLVEALASIAGRALLLCRRYAPRSAPEEALLDELEPWRTTTEERGAWPNTSIGKNTQIIHEFALSPEVVQLLCESVLSLYGWGRGLPEDLALLREDGSVVLYSTTHEEMGGLCLSDAEKENLERQCPWLSDYVTWRIPDREEQEARQAGL